MHHDPADLAAATAAHAEAAARLRSGDPAAEREVELSLMLANSIAAAILSAPAATPEEVRAKAAAMAWELEGEEPGAVLDDFRLRALRGLIGDLTAGR